MTEITTTTAPAADEAPEVQPNPNRVWFRPDYSRAITFVRTSRQARYGAPWDAKDLDEAGQVKINAVAALLASAFADDNPLFDAESWLAATQLPAKPELPEGASDDLDDNPFVAESPEELSALLSDDEGDDA